MAEIATGIWWNYSKSRIQAWTLTLSLNQGNVLLSGLTLLVTLAGASFWNITAFALYRWKVRQDGAPTAFDLQQQVILRNSRTSVGAMWDLIKLHHAWSGKPDQSRRRWVQTCVLVVPAMLVWMSFIAAAIFTARLANGTAGAAVALIKKGNCGLWEYERGALGLAAYAGKLVNDTSQARTYVGTFYTNHTLPSSSKVRSRFVQSKLPIQTTTTAPCPVPAASRCLLGANRALGMTTGLLDSHEMLGINAPRKDRVALQLSVTCSPISVRDSVELIDVNNATFLIYFLGDLSVPDNVGIYTLDVPRNWTYMYNTMTPRTGVSYVLASRGSYPPGKNQTKDTPWYPKADFFRPDADVSLHILSQNNIMYYSPVLDPFFYANGSNTFGDFIMPNFMTTNMLCADQYILCNPSQPNLCSTPSGWVSLLESLDILPSDRDINVLSELRFNQRQLATAHRLVNALANTGTYQSVGPLGVAALWANTLVNQNQSPGLPATQWQIEALGWFQTSLAKLQAYVVDYAANPDLGSPVGHIVLHGTEPGVSTNPATREWADAWRGMCTNQLVRASGEVQNFEFANVVLVVVASVVLILLSLMLEQLVNLIAKVRHARSRMSRQADEQLHLLRMALNHSNGGAGGASRWELGRWGIPVLKDGGETRFERPTLFEDEGELIGYENQFRASAFAVDADSKHPGVETVERRLSREVGR